jgi:hypothetical protein
MRGTYTVLVRKLEAMRLLGRYRRRWKDNIEMNIKEIWCEEVD